MTASDVRRARKLPSVTQNGSFCHTPHGVHCLRGARFLEGSCLLDKRLIKHHTRKIQCFCHLTPTADLIQNSQGYFEIYSLLLPIYGSQGCASSAVEFWLRFKSSFPAFSSMPPVNFNFLNWLLFLL